ncbi:hypothetical protein CLAFUW4_10772 [Fulvia fulva]|uniref:Uncharacterized protein n=1 Tax=Passalora fulva TaxID=5499 RepID=A0A9Q8US14_PASFU|nr:uncharacterized protein CLAFUR5_09815 [Fulvia fulva]KAK4619432.1 hypothetical protein CLAFUR4_10777 [Fulvia fulva]KAK4620381.1 hypothetical protein CLAFUR0_10784 [Fulvia fulva]UJO20305.1 hypothetical protein CLAFUR5_09815 [Fulvia fulva]WPV17223.1 hypothetical protein CLAFUW4_10772 [Fulvia fulva]
MSNDDSFVGRILDIADVQSSSPSPPPQQPPARVGRLPSQRGRNIYDVPDSDPEDEDEDEDEDNAATAAAGTTATTAFVPQPARIGRPRSTRAAYYRPVVAGRYYRVLTQHDFDRLREAKKRRYLHVDRIEEVAREAEVMTLLCRRCLSDLRGRHPCRKYTRIAA